LKTTFRAICAAVFLCLIASSVSAQVPVSLSPVIRQQFFSSSGTPLAGGFVYVYCAGTSMPCPTYLDSTGTNMATSPITLDSGGFSSIWLPATPVDIAVFNSSGTQQYKVLNVTALPLIVTSLTANYFQSSTTNPALGGFIRAASTDQICWRNPSNSADDCLSISGSAGNNLFWQGTQQFAFLNTTQNWTGPQNFIQTICWQDNTPFSSCFTNGNTAPQVYSFPNATGIVCISSSCTLTNPILNGVTISGAPTGPGQTLVSTSSTSANWGTGAVTDYDNYTGANLINASVPFSLPLATIPISGVEATGAVGSYIEGEVLINNVTYTGSAPTIVLYVNSTGIGPVLTLASSLSYDLKFSLALSSNKLPQANISVISSSPAVTASSYTSGVPAITGSSPTTFSFEVATATTVTMSVQFIHVRVRY
jgi:hypothetical protein